MTERDPRYRPELRKRAVDLYGEGRRTLREVGGIMGISHERVRKLVVEGGGKLRGPGPRKR
jgi:DNA-directed RNA polymerase sigma subunit (sigma70/sigma32)